MKRKPKAKKIEVAATVPLEPEPAIKPATDYWAVMKVQVYGSIVATYGIFKFPLAEPKNGSVGFIMVFASREQAVAFNGGSEENIAQMRTNPQK